MVASVSLEQSQLIRVPPPLLARLGLRGYAPVEILLVLEDLPHALDPVRRLGGAVPADALDPRESQGEAAGMPLALLDRVERHLEDDLRAHRVQVPVPPRLDRQKQLRELVDLRIRHPAVGLAD